MAIRFGFASLIPLGLTVNAIVDSEEAVVVTVLSALVPLTDLVAVGRLT